ncbi:MAG: MBOAT family protein [Erysipelotrichaceae bacterium]|nr:MBOAT family protein [Erysipelotrichaceae bacterium]
MSFISPEFIVFFILFLSAGSLIQKFSNRRVFRIFLLIADLVFYSYFDYRFSFLLLFLTVITYFCGLKATRKPFFCLGILIPLLLLGFFKYCNFFLKTIGFSALNIILPLGISFYSFEAVSYICDIHKNRIDAEKNFILFASYLCFFPNIISGPIVRANDLLHQFKEDRKISMKNIETGIQIMAIGYFKKMVIADRIAVFVNDVYAAPKAFSWLSVLLAVLSYSIQIYMDFSGYSDIAIGISKCLGFDLKKNFDLPYLSGSVTEFWRRWHISLSSWFRDYVYIPLGGNRKGRLKQYLNLLIVMGLSGIWHGADWTFLLWGLVNGLLMCLEKPFLSVSERFPARLRKLFTFFLITLTWIFFRAENFVQVKEIFIALFTFQQGIFQPYLWSFTGFLMSVLYLLLIKHPKNGKRLYDGYYLLQDLQTVKGLTLFFIFIGLLITLAYTASNPFVYFQF